MRHIEVYFPKEYWQKHKNKLFKTFPEDAYIKISTGKLELLIEDEGQNSLLLDLKNRLTETEYNELEEMNEDLLTFETENYQKIYLRMGTFGIISAITAVIMASFVVWAQKYKNGRIYTEEGEYKFEREDETGEKQIIRRKPDISYISYDDVPEEEQNRWNKQYITTPATLAVEIVSSHRSLPKELKKMREVWMKYGTKLGLVICPFSKKIYVFEKDKEGYTEQSIYEKFTHELLPGYEGDFSMYIDEVE